ncbi:unnamed protein product [Effrenium voratum]|nr:unnamed protein product [Effrenium voratum]
MAVAPSPSASVKSAILAEAPGSVPRSLRRFSTRGLCAARDKGCELPSFESELPSFEELERDMQGWNGPWKKKKAAVLMQERLRVDHQELVRKRLEKEEHRRRVEERREQLRRTMEEEQRELQEEIQRHETRQRAQRLACAWSDFARRAVMLRERLIESMRQPSECLACRGTGRCARCHGQGTRTVTYLSSNVQCRADDLFRGRCVYGCHACGGVRDGTDIYGQASSQLGTGLCGPSPGHGYL